MTVVTLAIAVGLPLMSNGPGLTGLTGRAAGISTQYADLSITDGLTRPQAGYSRPPGALPFYGFDAIRLETPMFRSWWDGKAAHAKLKQLNANTVILDSTTWNDPRTFHDTVARLHGNGIRVIVKVTQPSDWVDLREDVPGKPQPVSNTFVTGRAARVFAQARNNGVGRIADFVLLGGDALSYATQAQRQKMYQLAKQYFPTTPVVRRYIDLDKAEAAQGKPHPMGGSWSEYRFGQDECDIALISIGRGVEEGRAGVKVSAALEQLNQILSIVKSRHHEAAVVVSVLLADEKLLSSTKTAMWSTKEVDQFVTAMLTSEGVDGLLVRGLGTYSFDLGHPDFSAQRIAFSRAAPVSSSRSPAGE